MERTHHPRPSTTVGKQDRRETNKGNYIQDQAGRANYLIIDEAGMVATRECAGPPSKMPPRNKGEAEKRKNEHPHRTHTKKKKPKEVANITGIEMRGFLVAVSAFCLAQNSL